MPRKRESSEEWRKPLSLWEAPPDAGEPLHCIATTFTFDAAFFESECLSRFLGMTTDPREGESVEYLIEREERLAASRVSVLVDRQYADEKESMRWDVLPVVVPGAIQHSKISLLCWTKRARLIIGSGNLTPPGYRENLEVFAAVDISPDEPGYVDVVQDSLGFLEKVAGYAVGRAVIAGPKQRALELIDLIRQRTRGWPPQGRGGVRPIALFSGPGMPLFDALQEAWPSGGPPRQADVLSPFFDQSQPAAGVGESLLGVMASRGERKVDFYVDQEPHEEGRTRLFMPHNLVTSLQKKAKVSVRGIRTSEESDRRSLHAKMLVLSSDAQILWMLGSSNFTTAGYGMGARANLEANLGYVLKADSKEERDLGKSCWPPCDEPVDPDSDKLVWNPAAGDDEEDASGVILPAGFQDALYDGKDRCLRVRLGSDLPVRWSIALPDGPILARSDDHDGQTEMSFPSEGPAIPRHLTVCWEADGQKASAPWIVNALELGSLPSLPELRNLALQDLLLVLGNSQPLHIAMRHVLKRKGQKTEMDVELDPHRRVNTETYLLKRTKRVALALHHLGKRLERPVATIEGLEWRLRGPVGPLRLAEVFRQEARTLEEARFFLAELALTLGRIRPELPAAGGLPVKVIRAQLKECIDAVQAEEVALRGPQATAIDSYIKAAMDVATSVEA